MVVPSLAELKIALRPGQRLLGLDLGEKTIGLALSDTLLSVATPLKTLERRKFSVNADELLALAKQHGIGGFVVGSRKTHLGVWRLYLAGAGTAAKLRILI